MCVPEVTEQEVILKSKLAEGYLPLSLMTPVWLELFYVNPCLNECRFEFLRTLFLSFFSIIACA